MTEARQIIPDLETSKKYLIKAEVIDKNLGVSVGQSVAVFETPADSTIPDAIDSTTPGAFLLFSNSKSVMFRFNAPLANDIAGYDYEVYATNSLSGTLLASGESYTTVFTVILSGSETTPSDLEGSPKVFYGRVRAFDTTGNEGPWTPLIASQSTLVDSAEITSLTASKIKAGTITSSIINLDGANSVIRSTNYVSGTDGWAIRGDGTAEFSAGVIRGTVKAGSVFIDANNRWKSDATGATITTPEFKVGSSSQYVSWDGTNLSISTTGNVSIGSGSNSMVWNGSTLTVQGTLKFPDGSTPVNSDGAETAAEGVITSGFVGGLTINSSKMYYGAGSYSAANTGFYVANNGGVTNFSLGDKLAWNGSTLSITGSVVITGGSGFVAPGGAANDINNNTTTISGGKITTGTITASQIAANTITADKVTANFIDAFSINANNITAGTISANRISGGEITGSSFRTSNDRTYFATNSYIGKFGVEVPGEGATQCELYAGSNQGLRVQTSYNGEIWFAGSSIYVNLNQFTSARSIVGLDTSTASGTTLVVSGGQVFRTSSKRELKENIQDFNNIALIDGLRPRTFTWKISPNKFKKETEEERMRRESSLNLGFIAEEVEEASDGLLSIYNYEEGGNGEVEMYKHLDILALAVANIQDLRKRVSELESNR